MRSHARAGFRSFGCLLAIGGWIGQADRVDAAAAEPVETRANSSYQGAQPTREATPPLNAVTTAPEAAISTKVSSAIAQQEPGASEVGSVMQAPPADPMLSNVAPAARTLASWTEAMNVIKARSLDLRVATLDVVKSEAQSRTALAAILPSLNASANYSHQLIQRTTQTTTFDANNALVTRSTTAPTPDTASASLSLSVPLVNAPAWYALGTAAVSEDISRLTVDDLKRRLTLGVANAIVSVVTAERVAELNRTGLANALTRHGLAAAKLRNGIATSLDLERAKQDVMATRSALITGDESLRQSREALGLALGYSEAVGVRPDMSLDSLLAETQKSCRSLHSLKERADFAVLDKKRILAERQVTGVKLQFLPTLNLGSALSTTTPKSAMAPPATWNIQAVLNWALWDGGARYGSLRSARAGAEQAVANREALDRSATLELVQAQRGITVAADAVEVSLKSRDVALQIDAMTQRMFRAGMATSLELVAAATALRQAEINLATRQFDLVRAQIAAAMTLASCPW